ncbi:hypothetical protein [Bacteroides helcogenes]|nr:hypothetical protein [Bacteroides helcogenes]MDY5237325.1 hypothetical protein [Bacteroides helcogenes]
MMKQFGTWLLALLLAAFQPLSVAILVLMSVWTFNIIMGIAADKNAGNDFRFKKAFTAAKQLGFIFAVLFVISLATTGYDERELVFTIAKWGTWVVSLFYVTNIFRNAHSLWPRNKAIAFIYSFLTTEAFGYLKDLFKMRGGLK